MQDNSYSRSVLPTGMGARRARFGPHLRSQQEDPYGEFGQTENAGKFKQVYENGKKGKGGLEKPVHKGPWSGLLQENPRAMTWDRDVNVLLGQGNSKNMIKAFWPDTGTMKMTYKVSGRSGLPNLRSKPQCRVLLRVMERKGIDTTDRDYVALHERVYGKRTMLDEPEGFRGKEAENYHKTEDATKMTDEKKEKADKEKYFIKEDDTIDEKKRKKRKEEEDGGDTKDEKKKKKQKQKKQR
tara:strand:- start:211 stop:930 length:720 start_codon:yes stop_codon:yes gene_type:complete